MKRRFVIRNDFYAGLSGGRDYAVYDIEVDAETPIAVFARKKDAVAFRRTKIA